MKTLVICAHLDDESFGLGGKIIEMTNNGPEDVRVITLCRGRSSIDGEKRLHAFTSIMEELKCQFKVHDYKDLTLDSANFIDLVAVIQHEIDSFRPQRVFSTSENDLHRDHRVIAEATKLACRPLGKCSVKELYQFKIPGASDWSFSPSCFNVAFDISPFIEKKIEFCSRYKSEIKQDGFPGPGTLEGLKLACKADGHLYGLHFAELCRLVYKRD